MVAGRWCASTCLTRSRAGVLLALRMALNKPSTSANATGQNPVILRLDMKKGRPEDLPADYLHASRGTGLSSTHSTEYPSASSVMAAARALAFAVRQ